ncbi:hypothetical protein VNO77_18725 [Canavalia gladiata]|uniref:Uncharacterized protein n=1 Tax=Canavalia gladiata TaxID=3824 RepID=A0AAN9LL88_CANGL
MYFSSQEFSFYELPLERAPMHTTLTQCRNALYAMKQLAMHFWMYMLNYVDLLELVLRTRNFLALWIRKISWQPLSPIVNDCITFVMFLLDSLDLCPHIRNSLQIYSRPNGRGAKWRSELGFHCTPMLKPSPLRRAHRQPNTPMHELPLRSLTQGAFDGEGTMKNGLCLYLELNYEGTFLRLETDLAATINGLLTLD